MENRILVGTRKGLFILRKEKNKWMITIREFIGVEIPIIATDPRDESMYAAVEHGHFGIKLHRSQDQGLSWSEISTPKYPKKPADAPEVLCPFRKIPIPWSLENIWSLVPGGPDQPGVLWAGTIPGGLFKSTDHGTTWSLIESLWNRPERGKWAGGGYDYPGIHSICVAPRDSNHITVGVSCGGVWKTTNGGIDWMNCDKGMRADYAPPESANDPDIQDPHLIVQCSSAPDAFWPQHHNGISASNNNCGEWRAINNVKPSDFGFVVAVHPKDQNCAWFIPGVKDECRTPVDGKVVVTRTRDGGDSFETLAQGLPQTDAYDIVFRHGLDVNDSGEQLAFGSTTGSLWVTENGGDQWSQFSAHFPPIYCVRLK